ncbi:MAG: 50S ribosomal protein L13 [Micavibrio sp.]|nr:50S ribosomal protein L13 [Micavibrio sp.]HCK32921.1 50S ribosomal protein L13 [Rhodospirillaceae bacterium]|tara:strand:+ start:186 stop:653 length:468 start_codon:yes stop_codon:yes gene_type:complete
MKTYSAKPSDIQKDWVIVDAEGVVLGRLAAAVATRLRGKHKASYTPHMDCGDNVIIINADKVRISGNKKDQEVFYWHTGHPGGIKGRTQGQILEGKHPERVVENAVRRMLPKDSSLARQQYKNLRVYAGTEHPHEAQKPTVLDIATANSKNKRNA